MLESMGSLRSVDGSMRRRLRWRVELEVGVRDACHVLALARRSFSRSQPKQLVAPLALNERRDAGVASRPVGLAGSSRAEHYESIEMACRKRPRASAALIENQNRPQLGPTMDGDGAGSQFATPNTPRLTGHD